jgi:hypothetical protein
MSRICFSSSEEVWFGLARFAAHVRRPPLGAELLVGFLDFV